jgi:hypothetical protein
VNHPDRPTDRVLSEANAAAEAARLIAEGYSTNGPVATSYKDVTDTPLTGAAPPVPQAGRAPMSQKATDASAIMLAAGVASVPVFGGISLVMWTAGQVDPVIVGIVAVTPVALLGVLSRVVKRTKEALAAAPPVIHQHYTGDVHQDNTEISTHTKGVIARTNNRF